MTTDSTRTTAITMARVTMARARTATAVGATVAGVPVAPAPPGAVSRYLSRPRWPCSDSVCWAARFAGVGAEGLNDADCLSPGEAAVRPRVIHAPEVAW